MLAIAWENHQEILMKIPLTKTEHTFYNREMTFIRKYTGKKQLRKEELIRFNMIDRANYKMVVVIL